MKKSVISVFLLILLTIMIMPASSDNEKWIIKYRIEDLKTKQLVLERDFESGKSSSYTPIFAGAEYNITLTLKIPMSVPYATLTLKTLLKHSSLLDRYWETHSSPPPTIIDYNPNSESLKIKQEKGTMIISLYGKVPDKITENRIDEKITLHSPVNYIAVELKGPDLQALDNIIIEVIDSKIFEYRNLLEEKESTLQNLKESSPKVAPAYIDLFENVISRAKYEEERGFVDKAIGLLNILTAENPPREHVPSMLETFFFPIVGGLVVVAAILGFLSLRAKGKIDYVLMVVEDQIRELEGLTFRLSKIDKNIYSNLEEVKNRLKSLVEA